MDSIVFISSIFQFCTDVAEGGETVFPSVGIDQRVTGEGWSECAKGGLAVKASKGDALLFYSLQVGVVGLQMTGCCTGGDQAMKSYSTFGSPIEDQTGLDGVIPIFLDQEDGITPDPLSMHGSCPTIRGDKWSATVWIRRQQFQKQFGSLLNPFCFYVRSSMYHWFSL